MDICDRLRQDYANFPEGQGYDLYAENVYFQDPLTRFYGVKRYQEMIGFIRRWFIRPHIELHGLERKADDWIQTRWTLRWVAPLPWKPAMAISGWSDYRLNAEGKIVSHIDYWHCSRLDVLKQVFGGAKAA